MSRRRKNKIRPGKVPGDRLRASDRPVAEVSGAVSSRPSELGNRSAVLPDRWAVSGVCIFLAAIVWLVFGQTLGFGFVDYDDNVYVYGNSIVQKGLTWKGFCWACSYGGLGHWHPLTWLSHMLDCQFYGLHAGGHHLTNVLLHMATVILLFLVLRSATGALWRSAFVAAVFAIHPLRAESVAWIAERKDVLSAFFFMVTLAAYLRYVRQPSITRYCVVMLGFALGLLSKNMLVTLPFVLLLLDYWPLNRFSNFSYQVLLRLLWEKVPMLVLAVGSVIVTLLVPETISSHFHQSFGLRVENAAMSCATYIWQMIYPSGLACLYPNPANYPPFWQVASSLGLLLVISAVTWAFRKQYPWLMVGWLWYLGMLVPVIGIVQISYYAHADRYTYLPQIGLYLLLTWMVAERCHGWRHHRAVLSSVSVVVLAVLIGCARMQVSYWRNSELLWTHALACTSNNFVGHTILGTAFLEEGRINEAIPHFQEALQINPDYENARYNLGNALLQEGNVDEAIDQYREALQIDPDDMEVHYNLGNALLQKGNADEAIAQYQSVLQINPDNADAQNNLGAALFQKGNVNEAIRQYQKTLQINPDFVKAHINLGHAWLQSGNVDEAITQYREALQIVPDSLEVQVNLGYALAQKGNVDEAIAHFRKALQINPDNAEIQNNLAWMLATCPQAALRNGNEAVALAQRANQLTGGVNPMILGTLAAAYAETGRFPEAIETAQRALQLAKTQPNPMLANAVQSQLKLYQAGLPFHLH